MDFRFVNRNDKRQPFPPLFIDNERMVQWRSFAHVHHVNLRDNFQSGYGNKFHIICPRALKAVQHTAQQENVDVIRRIVHTVLGFMPNELLQFWRKGMPVITTQFKKSFSSLRYTCEGIVRIRGDDNE